MKLIVNTNILFSFFNERSKARELSLLPDLELHSPAFSIGEIAEHRSEILTRFSLSDAQFLLIERLLKVVVKFIKEEEYCEYLSEARKVSPDPNDSDFFALALKFDCPLWSEDKRLKKQSRVKVLSTKELMELQFL
ncbi:MAG: hypothetical protein EFT35_03385 [Methanophagales archaeon ANME-1-THS]|nr:MAG: hypothetical protein EFT35_03385 [Methanophagales archaeon ANME-1-THS]